MVVCGRQRPGRLRSSAFARDRRDKLETALGATARQAATLRSRPAGNVANLCVHLRAGRLRARAFNPRIPPLHCIIGNKTYSDFDRITIRSAQQRETKNKSDDSIILRMQPARTLTLRAIPTKDSPRNAINPMLFETIIIYITSKL